MDGLVPGLPGPRHRRARTILGAVLDKSRFWQAVGNFPLNQPQRRVLSRLLDGFEGKLTTSKWAKLAKCSQDTALRDIVPLVDAGILIRSAQGGRSTSYTIGKIGEIGPKEKIDRDADET